MSLEQAKAFIEKMKSEEAFKERILAVEDVEERMEMIKAEGFDCTKEEIRVFLQDPHNFPEGVSFCTGHHDVPGGAFYCDEFGCGW